MEKLREEIRACIDKGIVKTEGVKKLSWRYKVDKKEVMRMWLEEKEGLQKKNVGSKKIGRGKYVRNLYKDKKTEVIVKAIKNNGAILQKIVAMEELAELQQALSKDLRNLEHNVEEEIADVKIMLEQLELMYDKAEIECWVDKKIDRLDKRMKE